MKTFKTFLCITFMLSGTLIGPHAEAADAKGTYVPFGSVSCSTFLREHQSKSAMYLGVIGWLAGYVTAYNQQTPNTYNILGSSDIGGAELWMKNFCEKNPLENISVAAGVLMIELYPRRTIMAPN